jgi:hypothetical protein
MTSSQFALVRSWLRWIRRGLTPASYPEIEKRGSRVWCQCLDVRQLSEREAVEAYRFGSSPDNAELFR